MDKVPGLTALFVWTAVFLLAAFVLARWKAWAPLLTLPFSAFYAIGIASELFDPHVGPAILAEGGWAYLGPALLTVAVNLLAPVAIALRFLLAPGVRSSLRGPSRDEHSAPCMALAYGRRMGRRLATGLALLRSRRKT